MVNSLKLHLTEAELETVREAMNHDPRPEIRQRATAIHLLHLNYKPAEVAEMTAVTPATIYNWGNDGKGTGLKVWQIALRVAVLQTQTRVTSLYSNRP